MMKQCVACGVEFDGHHNAKACSDKCKKTRNMQMAQQWRADNPGWEREYWSRPENHDRRNERKRNWRVENIDHVRERDRNWYAKNAESQRERCRERWVENPDLMRERARRSRWKNRDKNLVKLRQNSAKRTAAIRAIRELGIKI